MIQPPTIGPTVGASTASTPAIVVASACRRSGNSRKTAENTAGISVPPEKPWSTRQAISAPKLPLAAQPTEASGEHADGARRTASASSSSAGQEAGQRDRDHLGDQIGGLHPAHLVGRDAERALDRRQRGRDDLDVEDRHEHADAHHGEARPDGGRDGARAALFSRRRSSAQRAQGRVLGADAHREHRGVQRPRKRARYQGRPKAKRQHRDLADHDDVVRMREEAVRAGRTSGAPGSTMIRVVQRRAERRQHPERAAPAAATKTRKPGEVDRPVPGEEPQAGEPGGMQGDDQRIMARRRPRPRPRASRRGGVAARQRELAQPLRG